MNPGDAAWRVAVVGGGLSGLAAGHRLQELCAAAGRKLELVLLEAGPRVGGLIETRDLEGYRVELGADSFITNKPWGVDLCRRLGLEGRLIPTDPQFRRTLVLHGGKPVFVPDGFQLLSPVRLGPVLASPLFSPWGKMRMALETILPRGGTGNDESLASFVRRRFGHEALERLVQPLVGGIYTSDPEKLSLEATLPRFLEMERRHGSLIRALRRQSSRGSDNEGASGARYGLFATFPEGVSELFAALVARVSKCAEIRLNTAVTAIHSATSGPGCRLELADRSHLSCDAIVLAIPAYRVAELVLPFAPEWAQLLARIEYASTAIVISGHKLSDIRHPLDAFGLVIPAIEKRSILAVSFTSRKFPNRAPAGCVQLRTFVGGAMQPGLFALPDAEILKLVRSELEAILGVRGAPDFEIVARYPRSMPQYHVGHLDLVRSIETAGARFPHLALAGNAYRGVGIPDSIHSGEQAAERVFAAGAGTT